METSPSASMPMIPKYITNFQLRPHLVGPSHRSSGNTTSKLTRYKTLDTHFTVKSSKEPSVFMTESRAMKSQTNLQSLINECASFQASVGTFKCEASNIIGDSKVHFSRLKEYSQQASPDRFYESDVYKHGKAVIAAKVKAQLDNTEDEQLKLVKSLMYVSDADRKTKGGRESQEESPNHTFVRLKDLTTKRTLKLLAINRRKFGESYPSSLKILQRKHTKPKVSNRGNLEESLRKDIDDYMKLKVDCTFTQKVPKSPPKSRQVLATEQEQLMEQVEQMTPLNQLIMSRSQKFRPMYNSQLNYKRNLVIAKRLEQIKPSSQVVSRANSITRVRRGESDERQISKTAYPTKRSEEYKLKNLSHEDTMKPRYSKTLGYQP